MISPASAVRHARLLRRGRLLKPATLAWNVLGPAVLAVAAERAQSVARVTVIDGLLAGAVLLGLLLNSAVGWWWADPAAGLVIVHYAIREARAIYAGG